MSDDDDPEAIDYDPRIESDYDEANDTPTPEPGLPPAVYRGRIRTPLEAFEELLEQYPAWPVEARATVFLFPSESMAFITVWVGQGFYHVPVEDVARILEAENLGDGEFLGPRESGIHPCFQAWPLLRTFALVLAGNEENLGVRFGSVLRRVFPEKMKGRPWVVPLDTDMTTVLAVEAFHMIREALLNYRLEIEGQA